MRRNLKEKLKEEFSTWCYVLLPGFLMLIMFTIARANGWIQFLELLAFDSYLKMRPPEKIDDRIVIVGIGEKDIASKLGYPVSDRDLADLIKKIEKYQPRVIGLDLVRDIPVKEGNRELTEVLQENKNLIAIEKVLPEPFSPPPNLPPERIGFVDVTTDSDSNLRRVILAGYLAGEFKFSLSYLLAKKYLAAEGITPKKGIVNPKAIRFGSTELPVFSANSGGYVNKDDGWVQIILNYRSGSHNFKTLSYTEVVSGKFDPDLLRDRIVLIGMTAPSVGSDIFNVSGINSTNPSPGTIYGVEIIAHSVSQIISGVLNGRPLIKVWPEKIEYIWIWFCGIWGMVLARFCVSPWIDFLIINMSIILVVTISLVLFYWGWWIPVVPSLLVLSINNLVISAFAQHDRALRDRICIQRSTIEHTFEDIHNGPLQTLKSLMREVKDRNLPQDKLLDRLETLDRDLRKLYEFLQQETFSSEDSILLGNGVKLDLNRPLHELLFLVYRHTLERDFPCYKSLKITIPKFPQQEGREFNSEQKRGLCRFLEEALCNVGKYAEGATRLKVTFDRKEDMFFVRVEDNGKGITTMTEGQGSKQARMLARQLRGRFARSSISPKGTRCELTWPVKKFLF